MSYIFQNLDVRARVLACNHIVDAAYGQDVLCSNQVQSAALDEWQMEDCELGTDVTLSVLTLLRLHR